MTFAALSSVVILASVLLQSEQAIGGSIGSYSYEQVRSDLLTKREIALLDVREEDPFAKGHPLFAANLPFSRIELEAYTRIPRRNTTIVVYDNGEGLAQKSAARFVALGYTQVHVLTGGLEGWKAAGGEIFIDVNAPSKAFGEFVESKRHTPSLSAAEVKALLDSKANVAVVDVRRFDEYHTMSIPTSTSVPGAELVLRIRELVPDSTTKIIVNCAGRTRSIIGTQSLINAGIPNQVMALRNGTMGWTLAGQTLDHGQERRFHDVSPEVRAQAIADSRKVADRAGVKRITLAALSKLVEDNTRTTYRLDVRTPEEFVAGHLPGFRSAPGGQLVQETDHSAPVRGARIVLSDDIGVRANMSASWLAQMNWEVYVVDDTKLSDFTEKGTVGALLPVVKEITAADYISTSALSEALSKKDGTVVVDFALNAQYVKRHIPNAWYVLRSQLKESFKNLPPAKRYVLTSSDGNLAAYVLEEFKSLTKSEVLVLKGGTDAWIQEKYEIQSGESAETAHFASPRIDRYRRPYEGTNSTPASMQAYFDWEYGLVDQLAKDGTHGFFVMD